MFLKLHSTTKCRGVLAKYNVTLKEYYVVYVGQTVDGDLLQILKQNILQNSSEEFSGPESFEK